MSTSTLAVTEGSSIGFDAEEIPTERTAVTVTESGFWGNRASHLRKESARLCQTATAGAQPVLAKATRKIVAESSSMRSVLELLEPLARAEVPVTLIGETGTGKDVLARTIHQLSTRGDGPFVVFDCGAVAASLAESELLGHERGAFTGAVGVHVGAFERAHGGTLFLDEIGELPLELQTRLLRLLGNSSVRRVGGTQDRAFDVRIVAATNRDLQVEVHAGRFRRDLYFRLAAAVVQVPPLRKRTEDIPALALRLLEDLGHAEVRIAPDALRVLTCRQWHGNVRELKNTLACAIAFLDGQQLEARHLVVPSASEPGEQSAIEQLALGGIKLAAIEQAAIEQTLRLTGGNKARAAEILGIAPSTLYEKLKKYQSATRG
ncbi:MAG TPA: sigma-54 dependent transcriptional regulator [Polyangiaceae bacterium]|nr:sigma-54 dependent transcriptional regulator [Polyangiaceae bacterium]